MFLPYVLIFGTMKNYGVYMTIMVWVADMTHCSKIHGQPRDELQWEEEDDLEVKGRDYIQNLFIG